MICGWQIFMRLKTLPVLAPSRGEVKPPVQLVVLIIRNLRGNFITDFLNQSTRIFFAKNGVVNFKSFMYNDLVGDF